MKLAIFDTHNFEKKFFSEQNEIFQHEISYFDTRLSEETAELSINFPAVCVFTNDKVNSAVLEKLKKSGVQLIALRSAGFNNVDLAAAKRHEIKVVRVPAYSPYAVAEHAVALLLALNRKLCRASARVHDFNFSLDGLVGFDLHQKTVGVIGTGKIGSVLIQILKGFGCKVLAHDQFPNLKLAAGLGFSYCSLDDLYKQSEIISLHVPLSKDTKHLIGATALEKMQPGVMLINTSRGALVDTKALVEALKSGHVGSAALDVYEEEENIFFHDLSDQVLQDDVLARLLSFPNVLITAHQGFLTNEALHNIAETTLRNVSDFENGLPLKNEVRL